jgi:hypothetical protein
MRTARVCHVIGSYVLVSGVKASHSLSPQVWTDYSTVGYSLHLPVEKRIEIEPQRVMYDCNVAPRNVMKEPFAQMVGASGRL